MGLIDWMAKNPKTLEGVGSLLSAGGSIYSGVMTQQNSNKMIDLQQQGFDLQKQLVLEDDAERKRKRDYYEKFYGGLVSLNNPSGGV